MEKADICFVIVRLYGIELVGSSTGLRRPSRTDEPKSSESIFKQNVQSESQTSYISISVSRLNKLLKPPLATYSSIYLPPPNTIALG